MPDPIIYDDRHPDLFAHMLVLNEDGSIEAYGTQLDGKRVWLWIHKEHDCQIIDRSIHVEEIVPGDTNGNS